jgi:hypothetical protein
MQNQEIPAVATWLIDKGELHEQSLTEPYHDSVQGQTAWPDLRLFVGRNTVQRMVAVVGCEHVAKKQRAKVVRSSGF